MGRTTDSKKKLYVAEICRSVMGELPCQGLPSVILRLAGCNLRCSYCDTPHALEIDPARNRRLSREEIVEEVCSLGPALVLVTGGEPMCQEGTPSMIESLQASDMEVVLETNGSCDLESVPDGVICVADVKSPGSGEEGSFLDSNLKKLKSDDYLKFIIRDREDYLWSTAFLRTHGFSGEKGMDPAESRPGVLFSPAYQEMRPAMLVEWILEDMIDVRLNLQMHKYMGVP